MWAKRKRFDTTVHDELVASVRRLAILRPITVCFLDGENTYQIIAGERRYQAARTVGLSEVPCWVQTPKEDEILLHQIVENWQRADMHPFDLANALVRLHDSHGLSKKTTQQTGKSEGENSKLLKILDLDPDVQQTANNHTSGLLTRRHLYSLSRLSATPRDRCLPVRCRTE